MQWWLVTCEVHGEPIYVECNAAEDDPQRAVDLVLEWLGTRLQDTCAYPPGSYTSPIRAVNVVPLPRKEK